MNNNPCLFNHEVFDQAYWEIYFFWYGSQWGRTSFFKMQCIVEEDIRDGFALPPEVQ